MAPLGVGSTAITVTAAFTAEPLRSPLLQLLRTAGIDPSLAFAPHTQVAQQLLDPASHLSLNKHGINIVLVRLEDDIGESQRDGSRSFVSLIHRLQRADGLAGALTIIVSCPPSRPVCDNPTQRHHWRRIEERLATGLGGAIGVSLLRAGDIAGPYDLDEYYDAYTHRIANVPYTRDFFLKLALALARIIHASVMPQRKAIVLDCDNTLWSGLCGEDGPHDVVIDSPRQFLQRFMLGQRQAGVLLCLCSKNSESDVWNVFDAHAGMIITRNDIATFRINWAAKAENICAIADELGLDVDSFIFIDDDPVECATMQRYLPEVVTVRLPAVTSAIPALLQGHWSFDRAVVTAEDRLRAHCYHADRERARIRERTACLEEFIATLGVRVVIRPVHEGDLVRIAQLTHRITQFNFTLTKLTANELRTLWREREYCILSVAASDRYGDYGLVGALIADFTNGTMTIHSFLLSCRALGRNIEHMMLNEAQRQATVHRCAAVHLTFVQGPRNVIARRFIEDLDPAWCPHTVGDTFEYVLHLQVEQQASEEHP